MTIWFLKEMISGQKKVVYAKDVRHIAIPGYEGLTLKDIAGFLQNYREVIDYLPDGNEIRKVPKQWIANICATVLKEVFSEWVRQ